MPTTLDFIMALPAPYLFAIIMVVPNAFLTHCKILFTTIGHVKIKDTATSFIAEIIMDASGLAFLGCIHFWISRFCIKTWKVSTLPVNVFFLAIYVMLLAINIYDFENIRHNCQIVTLSTLKAYLGLFRFSTWSKPMHQFSGDPSHATSSLDTVIPSLIDNYLFWVILLIFVIVYIILVAMFLYKAACIRIFFRHVLNTLPGQKTIVPTSSMQNFFEREPMGINGGIGILSRLKAYSQRHKMNNNNNNNNNNIANSVNDIADTNNESKTENKSCKNDPLATENLVAVKKVQDSEIDISYLQNLNSSTYYLGFVNMWHPEIEFNNFAFKIFHVLASLHIIFVICYIFSPNDKRFLNLSSLPNNFIFPYALLHLERHISKQTKKNIPQITRTYLPKGRYWIDNRENPIYPLVHGDLAAYCAYNSHDEHNNSKNDPMCEVIPKQKPITKAPNVAFVIYESFNPFTYLIDDEFIDEHVEIDSKDPRKILTSTPYYSRNIMSHFREYSKQGITFSGMSSSGLPTISGWHSMMTGVPPSQSFINMIDGIDAHVDDVPSHFHDDNYRTMYISTSPFEFDGKQHWVWRRSAEEEAKNQLRCNDAFSDLNNDEIQKELMGDTFPELRQCTDEEIQKFVEDHKLKKSYPKWFDYHANYFPNQKQATLMNLSKKTLRNSHWQCDRILSAQFQLHWKQQKQHLKEGQSLFALTMNADPHHPYNGFDAPEYYDPIPANLSRFSIKHKKSRFFRVNKYSDKYFIDNIVSFLQKEDPNTIVVIVGDHGTRDIPHREKDGYITKKARLEDRCYNEPTSADSLFNTAATLLYLGNDQQVKEALKLNKLAGKTLKIATDHHDLTYTLMDIIARIKGESVPPTHKLGRNLIDLADSINEKLYENKYSTQEIFDMLEEMDWQSVSYVSHQIDYRRGSKFIRTHSNSPKNSYYKEGITFPTCVKKVGTKESKKNKKATKMFHDMGNYFVAHNYLFSKNQVYNYAFRDTKCIEKGFCELPGKLPDLSYNDGNVINIPIIAGIVSLVLTVFVNIILCIVGSQCFNKELLKSESVRIVTENVEV
ncbi:hypothetical protein TRFO_21495 [Tritrichomonas foetus]|uniref:Sulfatase N-terminal domain-containing protein n=1 Tax=Tritrichomonas foetus TaxID=1144522 RepID=A0A1J4KEZ9_9EUKA|nr:hypothetical protein TRFO_21495 [Tritrichomonas foetus]|eukprot:OHT09602.1 hypothetical protein TRFO_21495 [Tritrichomonas foetus]